MASSRVCMKPGCRRRVVWRAGHDPQRHLAGVCYVCWGERVRESAGPNRQARRAWRQVARASWCCHCAMTVPWAAHWIAAGHCVVRQEGFKIERPEGRAQLVRGTAIPAPSPTEMRPSRGSTPFEDGPRPSCRTPSPRAPGAVASATHAPASASADRTAKAEALASAGVPQPWRQADRFAREARHADRVAALILADNAVLVDGGFIVLKATGGRLAAIGTEVQAAIARCTNGTKARTEQQGHSSCCPARSADIRTPTQGGQS